VNAPQSPHIGSAKEIVVDLIFAVARGVFILSGASLGVAVLLIPGLTWGWSASTVTTLLADVSYDTAWTYVGTSIAIFVSFVVVFVALMLVQKPMNRVCTTDATE
jgi:hypothetical protein